ncbi:MAG: hypothetical protein H0A76_02150 [Candidatus Thiodubiliella endoseptemdiera]|uniref:Uncharacterized protein n=1 Tax=Candidatus Thiodubiliella endoseptemdiera TaxID=2738886 RepID=A0A853F1I4_9GAMM|nr:hypothetical protein [Candidatus Thiodubiliella endoseptemdiera]
MGGGMMAPLLKTIKKKGPTLTPLRSKTGDETFNGIMGNFPKPKPPPILMAMATQFWWGRIMATLKHQNTGTTFNPAYEAKTGGDNDGIMWA